MNMLNNKWILLFLYQLNNFLQSLQWKKFVQICFSQLLINQEVNCSTWLVKSSLHLKNIHSLILKIRVTEREGEKETEIFHLLAFFPRRLPWPELSWTKVWSQEPHLGFPRGWRGPKHLGQLGLFSPGPLAGSRLEVKQPENKLTPTWDVGITGGGFKKSRH